MLNAEQLEIRRTGVGASEAAAIMGISPWASPMDVWLRKTGKVNDEPTDAMEAGNYFEDGIARWYAAKHGVDLMRCNVTRRHVKYAHILATPDRYIVKARKRQGLVEIKDVGRDSDEWGSPGTDEIPKHYLVQVQQQLAVTSMPYAKLVAFFHDQRRQPRVYHIEPHAEIREAIINTVTDFWMNHVVTRMPPEVDGSSGSSTYLKLKYRMYADEIVDAPGGAAKWAKQYLDARTAETAAAKLKAEASNMLKAHIGERAGVRGYWGTATWKLSKGEGVDWEAAARAMAEQAGLQIDDVIAKHTKPPVRRFGLREPKR